MNNDAFRKLVSSTPARQDDATKPSKPAALGAKRNAFVPMTPSPGKAASNDDFARQVREQHAQMRPPKKYKSSAPKGSKFGAGYVDRAKARQEASDDQDDKAERIKALEEQAKLGTISWGTFEALRDQITGGDVSSTHLVKGLDRQLLERVRRGEDVLGLGKKSGADDAPVDVDDELEKLGEKEIALVKKEQAEKKGVKAVEPIAGKKRTRDELLAELKAQRKAAAEAKAASAPKLDGRWKKIGEQSKPKVEIDQKGREVVTVVQEDGTVKKMVKKVASNGTTADMPDISKHVLGADVAVPVQKPADADEESDEDIFAGAGTEYDPLGQEDEDEDEDSDDEGDSEGVAEPARKNDAPKESDDEGEVSEEPVDEQQPKTQSVVSTTAKATRNYFGDSSKQTEEEAAKDRFKGIENVLKKAANLAADKTGSDDEDDDPATREEREARKAKRARMLAQQDRDLEDMDLGFGGSRGEDEEDALDAKVKLAEWKGGKAAGDDGWEEDDGKRGDKKKRKPKKRKGDVNNAADIFRVIEGRKAKENK